MDILFADKIGMFGFVRGVLCTVDRRVNTEQEQGMHVNKIGVSYILLVEKGFVDETEENKLTFSTL